MKTNWVLYTRETCSECTKAKSILKKELIGFKEIIIGKDITREEVLELFPSARMLPVIVMDDRAIFNGVQGLNEYLDEKGYRLA